MEGWRGSRLKIIKVHALRHYMYATPSLLISGLLTF